VSELLAHARNLVIMLTAGGPLNDLLEMARSWGVRAVHVQQLAVPIEEQKAQEILVKALRQRVGA
jgi:copper homeostasis protein CutC